MLIMLDECNTNMVQKHTDIAVVSKKDTEMSEIREIQYLSGSVRSATNVLLCVRDSMTNMARMIGKAAAEAGFGSMQEVRKMGNSGDGNRKNGGRARKVRAI